MANLKQFLMENNDRYSMNRLLSFLVILYLCIDICGTIFVLHQPWECSWPKVTIAAIAIGGKVAQKFIEISKEVKNGI